MSEVATVVADARILAIVVARIGDTLLATPALRALKALVPKGDLTVLAHPRRACLLENLSFIDRLSSIDKHSALWRARLPWSRSQLAVVWGHDRALVDYGLRSAERVVVFDSPGLPDIPRLLRVARPSTPMHAVHERLLLATAAGAQCEDFRLAYSPNSAEREHAQRWLAARGDGHWLGIQPVSFSTKARRDWPLDKFADLMQRLAARYPHLHFVILGDAATAPAAKHLQAALPDRVVVAAGHFDLRASAALIGALDLYIGVDTGPTHIAGALGIPMVALYHCAYPGRNLMPLDHPALQMIEHPASGDNPVGAERSMAEIRVEVVEHAARKLLEGERR